METATERAGAGVPAAEAGGAAAQAPLSCVPEMEWERLLTLVKDGHLVPVIGPELLYAPWKDEPAVRLYDVWGETLAQRREIAMERSADEAPLLYRVASRISMTPNIAQGDLEYDIDHIIRGQEWPLPEPLRLLASFGFPLCITTTIDHLMMRAMVETCGAEKVQQISFNRGGNTSTTDLPEDFPKGAQKIVYHLFGATSTDTEGFAATEDELIEFSWSLIDHDYAPKRLFDFLRKKNILLIGCDFPDWLARFFIHALTRRPDSQIAVTYVSDCRECGLRDFLVRRKAHLLPPVSPSLFIAELHRRWKAQQHGETAPAEQASAGYVPTPAKKGSVFISYCHEDRQAAAAIRSQLDAAGIDTWMDETGLDPGVAFREVIRTNIENASFFIALISCALDLSDTDRLGRFVFKEWKWAEEVNEDRPPNACFLLPVAVDDTPHDAPFIDRHLRDAHWARYQDGKVPEELVKILQEGIRRFRSKQGGTVS